MFGKFIGIFLIAVSLLGVSCGGGTSSSTGGSGDTVSVTVDGVQAQYSDSAQGVTITAYTSGANMVVYLGAPSLTLTISFSNDPLANATATRNASITCIIGGLTYQGTVNCTLTSLGVSMGGVVQGSFPSAILTANGLPSVTISGSFSATRIN